MIKLLFKIIPVQLLNAIKVFRRHPLTLQLVKKDTSQAGMLPEISLGTFIAERLQVWLPAFQVFLCLVFLFLINIPPTDFSKSLLHPFTAYEPCFLLG